MYLLYVKNEPWWPRMAKTKMDDSGGVERCFPSVMFHGEEWNIDWNTMLLKNCEFIWYISHISHTSHIWYTYIYTYIHILWNSLVSSCIVRHSWHQQGFPRSVQLAAPSNHLHSGGRAEEPKWKSRLQTGISSGQVRQLSGWKIRIGSGASSGGLL
jgi:hypothetical protein